jgi:hypothetical protein
MRFMDMLRYVTGKQNKSDEPAQIQPISAQIVRSRAKTSLTDALEVGKRYGNYDLENKNWGCGCYSFDTLINDFNFRKPGEFTGYLATISNRFAPYCSEWGTVRLVLQTYKLEEALGRLYTDVKSSFRSLDIIENESLDAIVEISNVNYCIRDGKEYGTNRSAEIVKIGHLHPTGFLNLASLFAENGYVIQADKLLDSVGTSWFLKDDVRKAVEDVKRGMGRKLTESTYGTIVQNAKMPISDKYVQLLYLADKKGDTTSEILRFVAGKEVISSRANIISELREGVRLKQDELLGNRYNCIDSEKKLKQKLDESIGLLSREIVSLSKLLSNAEGMCRETAQHQYDAKSAQKSQLENEFENDVKPHQEKIAYLDSQIALYEDLIPKRKMKKEMYKKLYGQVREKRRQTEALLE